MRLIFSSITLFRSCGAPDITENSRIIIIPTGIATVRILSTGAAALIVPPASRWSRPSSAMSTRLVSLVTSARSIDASRKRCAMISRFTVVPIHVGSGRYPG